MEVKFVDVTHDHVVELAANMRVDDVQECHESGYKTALEAVEYSVASSKECRCCTVDGRVLAIYGVIQDSVLTKSGILWLLTTELVDDHRKTFVRYASLVLLFMKMRWRSLSVGIGGRHLGALRFAIRSGFKPGALYFDSRTGSAFVHHTIGG